MERGVLKKKKCDFSRLTKVLEASLKLERMIFIFYASLSMGVLISIVSSMNWLSETIG